MRMTIGMPLGGLVGWLIGYVLFPNEVTKTSLVLLFMMLVIFAILGVMYDISRGDKE